jgi:hypothetical protein
MYPGSAVRPRSTVTKVGGPPPGTPTFANRDTVQVVETIPITDPIKIFLDEKLKTFGEEKAKVIKRCQQDAVWKSGMSSTSFVSIWRIEKTKAVLWPTELYGKFYDGDCYVILHGFNHTSGKKTTTLKYRIFSWLGSVATSDEQVIGAIVAGDLERFLGYIANMYLERQNKESDAFKHLFPDGTEIMEGSVGAGFCYIDPERYGSDYVPIFFAADAHQEHTSNLSDIKVNEENVFILDWGTTIFMYVGSVSHPMIQKAAKLMADRLRFHRPTVHIIWNNSQAIKLIEECREVFKDFIKGPTALTSLRY